MARHDQHHTLAQVALQRRARQAAVAATAEADERLAVRPAGTVRMPESHALGGSTAPSTHDHDRPTIGAVLRLQQTHGNQTVQRLLQEHGMSQIQRDDELIPELTLGDYKIGPPKPTSETDDSQDTHEGRMRANQQNEDERGESPKPEWWKDKPRGKSTDPKDWADLEKWRGHPKPSGEGEFGPIPPAEEAQPGDYPLQSPVLPEDGAFA